MGFTSAMTTTIPLPYTCKEIAPVETDLTLDDCVFRTYTWNASKDNWKGRVIYIHGYRDRHEFIYELAEKVAKTGFDFFYFYQRGEGETRLVNDEKGVSDDYYAYKGIDDIIEYNVGHLKKKNLPPKLHLMGHSMGGGLTLNYACHGKYKTEIKSFSATDPLILLHKDTYPGIFVELVVRAICSFKFGRYKRVKSPLRAEFMTADPVYLEYLNSITNPEGLDGAFVETRDFILRGRKLLSPEIYTQIDRNVPLLICQGEDDHICDLFGSKKFIDSLNSLPDMKNKALITYPEGKHCITMDIPAVRNKAIEDLVHFVEKNA